MSRAKSVLFSVIRVQTTGWRRYTFLLRLSGMHAARELLCRTWGRHKIHLHPIQRCTWCCLRGSAASLYSFHVLSRYMYGETLGRWRSADLLIGLAYMARRELDYRPVADIAEQGVPFGWEREGQQHAAAQVPLSVPKAACSWHGVASCPFTQQPSK